MKNSEEGGRGWREMSLRLEAERLRDGRGGFKGWRGGEEIDKVVEVEELWDRGTEGAGWKVKC